MTWTPEELLNEAGEDGVIRDAIFTGDIPGPVMFAVIGDLILENCRFRGNLANTFIPTRSGAIVPQGCVVISNVEFRGVSFGRVSFMATEAVIDEFVLEYAS